MTTLDPWGAVKIDNYSKLFEEFGISRFILGKFSWDEIPGNDSGQLIEFLIQNFDANWLKTQYLFSWDEIPQSFPRILIDFLMQNYSIDWVKTARIEKIDDGRAIKVFTEKNYLLLKLNDETTEVTLEIDDGRTDKFIAKMENDKLNICKAPNIEKSMDKKRITISYGKISLSLVLNDEETKVLLTINNGRPNEYNVTKENGKLIIDLGKIPNPHRYMRRGVIFGHRSYKTVLDAMLSGKPFAALSGFMPSGKAHLGHKMVMEELIWHQKQGADVFLAIADMEAHAVRGKTWEECEDLGKDYILSAIALGLEPGAHIYFQSKSNLVKNLAFELGIKANFSEMSAIYGFNGETNISHMVSALTQSADILHPQLKEFGGPKPVVIPVGADQDPHIRLTRGLAYKANMFLVEERKSEDEGFISVRGKAALKEALKEIAKRTKGKLYEEHVDVFGQSLKEVESTVREVELKYGGYAFMPPASTYHKFMTGLQGGKMSSSIPESYIALTEAPEEGAKKVMRAKTGGRVTLEEQKKLGGEPEQCTVYELLLYHLVEDDNELLEYYKDCVGGTRVCGKCKKYAAELMKLFLKEHQEKREQARERLGEFGLRL